MAVVIINILVSIFGTVANGLIITAYWRNRRLRNMKNFTFLMMAITDLSVTAFVQPLFAVDRLTELLGLKYCVIKNLVYPQTFLFVNLSMITILILSLQSFLTLAYPYRSQKYITKYRLKVAVLLSWSTVIVLKVTLLSLNKIWTLILLSLLLEFLTIFIVIFSWVWTCKLVNRHRREIKTTQTLSGAVIVAKKKIVRSTVTSFLIISSLIACYSLNLGFLLHRVLTSPDWQFDRADNYFLFWCIAMTLTYSNSFVNPFLVFWRNSNFRATVWGYLS